MSRAHFTSQRMWTAIRVLRRQFDIGAIALTAGATHAVAGAFVRQLTRSGYLVAHADGQHFRLVRDTGPRTPARIMDALMDGNTGALHPFDQPEQIDIRHRLWSVLRARDGAFTAAQLSADSGIAAASVGVWLDLLLRAHVIAYVGAGHTYILINDLGPQAPQRKMSPENVDCLYDPNSGLWLPVRPRRGRRGRQSPNPNPNLSRKMAGERISA